MSTVHQLARALGAKRSGRQWVCRCPAHDDAAPSLIFWQGHSAIRFKCYSGCDPRDVLDALRRRGLLGDKDADRRNHSHQRLNDHRELAIDAEEERERVRKLKLVERIWSEAVPVEGTPGVPYFRERDIDITLAPDFGGLRWHPKCPWGEGATGCIIGRYTDAITGEPRGIWRRPINGEKPRAFGSVAGCVIRL